MVWDSERLERIGAADELQIASRRDDGSLRPFVTIWAVVVGGDLFVRAAYGPETGWYRRALASGTGRIRAGGIEADVTFADGGGAAPSAIDAEYHRKYDRFGARDVDPIVGEGVYGLTLRIVPG
jgi:hypothetical protein